MKCADDVLKRDFPLHRLTTWESGTGITKKKPELAETDWRNARRSGPVRGRRTSYLRLDLPYRRPQMQRSTDRAPGRTEVNRENKPTVNGLGRAAEWDLLAHLCKRIHYWFYVRKDATTARRYLGRQSRVLKKLPESELAIIRQEALAWYHQLRGESSYAIKQRKREIRLIEFLHDDVQRNLANGRYDEKTAAYALSGTRRVLSRGKAGAAQ